MNATAIIKIIELAVSLVIHLEPLISEWIKTIQDPEELKKLDQAQLLLSEGGFTETLNKIEEARAGRERELGIID